MRQTNRRRGGVMLEFSLMLPVLVLLFIGTVLFGHNFHAYNRMEESVRAGARFAAMQTYDAYHSGKDPAPPRCSSCTFEPASGPFLQKVRKIVAYGCDPDVEAASGCKATPIVEDVLPANVKVSLIIKNWVPKQVAVSIVNVELPTPFGKVTLNGKPVTTFDYVGNYMAPAPPKH